MKKLLDIALIAILPVVLLAAAWTYPIPGGLTVGDLLYAQGTGTLGAINAVAAGQVLTSAGTGTKPVWAATSAQNGITPASGTLTVTGIETVTGLLNANGGIAVDTSAFTVADTTGNTVIAGSLAANGGITVDSTAFIVADTTGITTIAGLVNANGGIAVDTSAFTVADTSGNTAIAGTLSVAGQTNFLRKTNVETGAGPNTKVLGATDCGSLQVNNVTANTTTYTLPAASNAGCQITFIEGDAGGEILINAAAVATCVITTFAAVGADADTAIVTDASCETGLKNTAATNAIGDSLTLVSDGTRWLGVGLTSGIWATQ